ncbi:MAG: nucleotidyl transferase AbiEii/AbiGii toxin family protein [Candidatus Thiodiazotropha sp. (ex. Lucinisca nassula)]|nr:nucleotidyl transferase AbiEii/AbiGii toxin family protein [Candidatus Thiodiazotropha sp. (ex. Lucinisca nassula)]
MNDKRGKNMAASVRDRLLALARERGEDFQLLLTQYGLERLLYRLSQSGYRDRFILKGAMLFVLWGDQPHRPTRDVDFLAFGDSSEAGLQAIFRELCNVTVEDDGLTLMTNSVRVEVIRDETEYGGIRVRLSGDLAGAHVPIQADIGFGDAVTPEANEIEYPTLLGNPAPHLRAYPRETVVAEKYQALVNLGIANSRMKDFYDLWVIARKFDFIGETLSEAIGNTFSRRRTPLPEHTPSGLSAEFHEDAQKNNQWNAFLRRNAFAASPPSLTEVCSLLDKFLLPPTQAVHQEHEFMAKWEAGGPWR